MSRNKMREARTERRARRRHDIALGAAGVGDDAVERKTAELGENARHGADRHCQYDDVGPRAAAASVTSAWSITPSSTAR